VILNAVEQTQAIIGTVDGRIVHWSQGAERLYGWTAHEAIGRRARDLLKQKNANGAGSGTAEPRCNETRSGAFSRTRFSRTHKDGRELAIAASCVSRCDGSGRAAVIELDDLIEPAGRGVSAEAARACQAGPGTESAARIVHEFNNLLGIITLNLELACMRAAAGGEVCGMIQEALDAAWQGAELVTRLAEITRRQPV
jgi:PAS domain S-box-containing protein